MRRVRRGRGPERSASTGLLVVTVTGVMAASSFMQYGLSAVSPQLIADLGLSTVAYGSLFTFYFGLSALGSLVLGAPTQRMGARCGMAVVAATAGLGLLLVGLAETLLVIYLGMVLSAVASSIANPATNLGLMNRPNRGLLIGIKQSGVQFSALLGGAVVAPLAQYVGWRETLVVCAGAFLFVLLPTAALVRPGKTVLLATTPHTNGRPSILGLASYAFLMGFGGATTIAFLPLYATDALGRTTTAAGHLLAIFGLCAVLGRVAWGYLVPRIQWLNHGSSALATLSAGALVATGLLLVASAWHVGFAYGGAALMGLTGAAWNGLVMASVVESIEPEHSARAAGRVMTGFFIGLAVGPVLIGLLVDRTGSFTPAWTVTAGIYVAAFLTAITGIQRRKRTGLSTGERALAHSNDDRGGISGNVL